MSSDRIVSVVDDEIDITQLFHDALCNDIKNVAVVSFNDPTMALEHFTNNKKNYALVISDLRMPNMNGLELLKKVKQIKPSVKTILISAHEVENDTVFQQYIKDGTIDKFIQKPITITVLCQQVSDQVTSYRSKNSG
jgi:DNA-binding NtrC family response regulator